MVTIPKGYRFAVAAAGFKKPGRTDLALVVSDIDAVAAGVFTTNKFQAAPVLVCKDILSKTSLGRGFVINSGQANACTGEEGMEKCIATRDMVAGIVGVEGETIFPASTGVIGAQLKIDRWDAALPKLEESLGNATIDDAAKAIMTTDSFHKVAGASLEMDGKEVTVAGIAKGAGMICPNMATMLVFVITDAAVDPEKWQEIIAWSAERSFNRITVDGDTSTNDTLMGLANGASDVRVDDEESIRTLRNAVLKVCQDLSYMLVQDAEGGTKVAVINVTGAVNDVQAELVARTVGHSPLVKTALFGCDPNWGRVVAAVGRSGAEFDPMQIKLAFGGITAFEKGRPAPGDLDALLGPVMAEKEIVIGIELGSGPGSYELLASDLTREYISINADYRT